MNEEYTGKTERINRALLEGFQEGRSVLEDAIIYALGVPGKRLRPLLYLTLCEAYGVPEVMAPAVALEMVHTYSLIHDDHPCMDNDPIRRGMPTVHVRYDDATALLAGDTLLTAAIERLALAPLPAGTVVALIALLTRKIGLEGMAGGQGLDLQFRGDREQIFQIHRMKTADLIEASLISAAWVAGRDEAHRKRLSEVALEVGIAFQLADDLLDVEGDEGLVGKKLQKDGANNSPNAALHWGVERVRRELEARHARARAGLAELGIESPAFLNLVDRMVFRNR